MSERGVFAVDRGIWDHPMLASRDPFSKREAWIWLVSSASWKEKTIFVDGKRVNLKRGQLAFSIRFMGEQWGWHRARVERFLHALKTETMIGTDAETGITVITICKYNEYQRVSLPDRDTDRAKTETPARHDRDKEEDIKYREDIKEEAPSLRSGAARATRLPDGWQPSEEDFDFARIQLSLAQASTELHKFRDFWRAKAGKDATKHDWSATWRNWIRRAVEQQPRGSPANGKPLTFREQQRQQHRDLLAELDQSIERDRQGGDPPNLRLLPGNGRG